MNVHFMAEAAPGFQEAPKAIDPSIAYIRHLRWGPAFSVAATLVTHSLQQHQWQGFHQESMLACSLGVAPVPASPKVLYRHGMTKGLAVYLLLLSNRCRTEALQLTAAPFKAFRHRW